MTAHDWMQVISIGVNLSVLGLVTIVVRKFTILELKVNQMWAVFSRRFGTRAPFEEGQELE